jgi:hypothetical protein
MCALAHGTAHMSSTPVRLLPGSVVVLMFQPQSWVLSSHLVPLTSCLYCVQAAESGPVAAWHCV